MLGRNTGLVLMAAGAALIVLGAVVFWGGFSWFGKLPGDIKWEGERTRVFAPLGSMLLLSAAVSLAMYLWNRFQR